MLLLLRVPATVSLSLSLSSSQFYCDTKSKFQSEAIISIHMELCHNRHWSYQRMGFILSLYFSFSFLFLISFNCPPKTILPCCLFGVCCSQKAFKGVSAFRNFPILHYFLSFSLSLSAYYVSFSMCALMAQIYFCFFLSPFLSFLLSFHLFLATTGSSKYIFLIIFKPQLFLRLIVYMLDVVSFKVCHSSD